MGGMLKIMGITRSSNCALRALTLTYLSGYHIGIARGFIMSRITDGGEFFSSGVKREVPLVGVLFPRSVVPDRTPYETISLPYYENSHPGSARVKLADNGLVACARKGFSESK